MRLSSASRFNLFIFGILALLLVYAAMGGRNLEEDVKRWWADLFGPKTPRQAYLKTIKGTIGDRDLELWDAAYEVAKTTPLRVTLPHRERMSLDNDLITSAQALRITAPAGRIIRVRGAGGPSGPVFGELFTVEKGPAGKRPVARWDTLAREIVYETSRVSGEDLVLVVQAAPWKYVDYELQITSEPALLFPVEGKDEKAIQSFWGAPRDGGRRKHEGNDIFAPKGTPLLAMTDGEITRVNNGGLGGKTVWLYDAKRDLRYYYAHLDEQKVVKGQYVERGDVIGTVGNTGNARTTPPHLHFGIYAGSAIDPYPFLQRTDELPAKPRYHLKEASASLKVPARGSHYLRISPERDGIVIRQFENGETVTGLGVTGQFYRVLTSKNEIGYVNFD